MTRPSRRPRLLAVLLSAIACAVVLAGCGSLGSSQAATYTPAAYYQTVNGVPDCYYVDTSTEVTDLIHAGLCPSNSAAVLAPLTWQETYWSYYSSPAYYDTYMPASYRSTYVHVTVVKFSKTYSKQISVASSKATYKSSTGKTVTGTSKLKFGTTTSGGSSKSKSGTTVHGGGSGTVSSCSVSTVELADKSGTSSSGRSGTSSSSHGGGSGSKSGTTGKSKTGSGSKGGC